MKASRAERDCLQCVESVFMRTEIHLTFGSGAVVDFFMLP